MNRWQKRKFWASLDQIESEADSVQSIPTKQAAISAEAALNLQFSFSFEEGKDESLRSSFPVNEKAPQISKEPDISLPPPQDYPKSIAQQSVNGAMCSSQKTPTVPSAPVPTKKPLSGLTFLLMPQLAGSVQLGVFRRRIPTFGMI